MNYGVKGTPVQWALCPLEIQLLLDMIEKWTHHSNGAGACQSEHPAHCVLPVANRPVLSSLYYH